MSAPDKSSDPVNPRSGFSQISAKAGALLHQYVMMPHQFQHCQEYADQRRLVHAGLKQFTESQLLLLAQPGVDPAHVNVDRRIVVNDAGRPGDRRLADDPPKRAHQVPQFYLLDRLVRRIAVLGRNVLDQAGIMLLPIAAPLLEHARGVAILLILQEAANQLVPRILDLFLDLVGPGEDLLRLDLDQHARHGHKIADRVDIQLFEHREVLQKLVGDGRDGDVENIHLVLAHQVQQQVHRPAEDSQIYAKIHQSPPDTGLRHPVASV